MTWKIYNEIKQYQSSKKLQYIQTDIPKSYKLSLKQQNLMEIIHKVESMDQIMAEVKDITWVILDDFVYDATSFIHPGGNCLIELCKGKEISRYFYGACGIDDKDKGHKHSLSAKKLLQSMYIGKLPNSFQLIKSKLSKEIEELNSSPLLSIKNLKVPDASSKFGSQVSNENYHDNSNAENLYGNAENQCLNKKKFDLKEKLISVRSNGSNSSIDDFKDNKINEIKNFGWILVNKIAISNDIMKFQMFHSNYVILNKIQRIQDFGKHFKVN